MLLPVPSDFISLFVDIRHYFWLYEIMTSQVPYNFFDNSTETGISFSCNVLDLFAQRQPWVQ